MYSAIVVGTDGSETANKAVEHAAGLAKSSGATLHVVHAFRAVMFGEAALATGAGGMMIDVERMNEGIADHARTVSAASIAAVKADGVVIVAHTISGDPSDAIIAVAQDVGADLLVVGNRGMSGMKRFVLGSVPNRIAHHAPCSVLIVNTAD